MMVQANSLQAVLLSVLGFSIVMHKIIPGTLNPSTNLISDLYINLILKENGRISVEVLLYVFLYSKPADYYSIIP